MTIGDGRLVECISIIGVGRIIGLFEGVGAALFSVTKRERHNERSLRVSADQFGLAQRDEYLRGFSSDVNVSRHQTGFVVKFAQAYKPPALFHVIE